MSFGTIPLLGWNDLLSMLCNFGSVLFTQVYPSKRKTKEDKDSEMKMLKVFTTLSMAGDLGNISRHAQTE